jgi:glutaminyl-peptide cyclotransferase
VQLRALAFLAILAPVSAPIWAQAAPVHGYRVVKTYPHDITAYTEGLEFRGNELWESTGLNGSSSIRRVDLASGKILEIHPLSTLYFGEGITFFANRLYQLTYQSGIAFEYDPKTFKQIQSFHYPGEGWALTHDAKHLIMSDGTSALRILDPATFREESRIAVREGTRPITNLNELELIEGEIWANIWRQKDIVVRIDPRSGQVNSWVDFNGLRQDAGCDANCEVLNGIAYDAPRKRIFVTGKRWPKLLEIQVVEK